MSHAIPNGWRGFVARHSFLTSLNHPGIAAIYGLEETDTFHGAGAGACGWTHTRRPHQRAGGFL